MTLLKGLVEGNLEQVKQQDINADKLYMIKDLPDNSITNEQMELAVNDNAAAAFFRINNTYICIDDGAYIKNHIYKWLGDSWEEIPLSAESDNITINKSSSDKLQAIGMTNGTDVIDYNTLYQAISTKWEV